MTISPICCKNNQIELAQGMNAKININSYAIFFNRLIFNMAKK